MTIYHLTPGYDFLLDKRKNMTENIKEKTIKWNGLELTPEAYEQVKDTFYFDEPSHWELRCSNLQINAINRAIGLLNGRLGEDTPFIPTASTKELTGLTLDFFSLPHVQAYFDQDQVEIEANKEILLGVQDEVVCYDLATIIIACIRVLSDIESQKWH